MHRHKGRLQLHRDVGCHEFGLHGGSCASLKQNRSLWLLQRSRCRGSLFDGRFARPCRSVRTFRPVTIQPSSVMETEDTSNDQRGLERRQFCRSLAPVFLLASLSLIFAHPPYHGGLTASFILGFLVLSIICGILGRRWILVAVAVAPIVGIVGLSILLAIA